MARLRVGKKLADGSERYLFITPAGGSTWASEVPDRLQTKDLFRRPNPLVILAAARVELGGVKGLLPEGRDPATEPREPAGAGREYRQHTFKVMAQERRAMKPREWRAGHFAKSDTTRLQLMTTRVNIFT